ncbi:hypothetical protein [Streptomyces palmae]|uniref:DNA primase/polymerase bifunctional N-terminal domain-containing protein n=1 Tax=Streptomyces palmae TaxID=1701085 RepID=A0A4Z0FSM3_9ACTN|nr:hypothetical protein [Streptomyces palmae]TGA85931.1 hypothetical protein E4099_30645 [Streptomyces palmae]
MNGAPAGNAVDWLVSAAEDPVACRRAWERDPLGIALLPAGRLWDVLILSGALGGTTLEALHRKTDRPGPVLGDFQDTRVGFFVPAGTAARRTEPGSVPRGAGPRTVVRGAGPGAWVAVPYPGRPAGGVRWLVPPDGSGHLTDPAVLDAAMAEAALRLDRGEVPPPGY